MPLRPIIKVIGVWKHNNMDANISNNCIINNLHEYSDDPLQYILFDESVSSGVVWRDAYAATSGQTNLEIVVIKKFNLKSIKGTSDFVTLSTNGEDYYAEFHFNAFRFRSATTNNIYVHCEGKIICGLWSMMKIYYFSALLLQWWMLFVNMSTNKITKASIPTKNFVFAWYHRNSDLLGYIRASQAVDVLAVLDLWVPLSCQHSHRGCPSFRP